MNDEKPVVYRSGAKHAGEKKKKRKFLIVLILLLLVTVAAVSVTIWAVFFREPDVSVLAPDYAPQEVESNAEKLDDDNSSKLEDTNGGGAVALMYKDVAAIDLSDKIVSLDYGNPSESTVSIVLRVVIQDTVIAQSGRLDPGNKVEKLDLAKDAAKSLKPGGYDGKFVVYFYDEETGEKSAMNTEIPIKITVVA